jgi:hypothetical protein
MFHVEQTTEDSAIEYESAASILAWNRSISLFVTLTRLDMQELYNWQWVQAQVAQSIDIWNQSALPPRLVGTPFSVMEQQKRERAYDEALGAVERELRKAPRSKEERVDAQNRINAVFARFAASALGLEKEAVTLLTDGFLPAGTTFARWARRFDPTLSMADIVQACRSAWTACGLQSLLGDPLGISPSILGYSLLYPYSDNYLDCKDVSPQTKLRFSERFRERLRGNGPLAANHREAALWALVQLIEGQYPRKRYPQVFDCLLAIHQAQEESIAQLGSGAHCRDAEILRITCAKGGTSVLADACLAHGWLTEAESSFSFEWGVLLQLGDDLQDVREDLRRGSVTLFTLAATAGAPLDGLVIQLLNFSERVAAGMDNLPNAPRTLKNLLKMSWRALFVGAVANSPEFFSPGFLAEAERLSSFRFGFLRKRQQKLTTRQGLYASLFEAFIQDGEGAEGEPSFPDYRVRHRLRADPEPAEVLADVG